VCYIKLLFGKVIQISPFLLKNDYLSYNFIKSSYELHLHKYTAERGTNAKIYFSKISSADVRKKH
jgi:hypothetical protein